MKPFTVAEREYDESIVLCTSTRADIVVTTAVHASRSEEPELLHALMDSTTDSPYVPFSEDRHSKVDSDASLYEATIDASATCLSVATKAREGDEQTQTHLHAVNASLLLEQLLPRATDPLVITTAGRTHARELLRAVASDACRIETTPAVTHGPKLWWYYPGAMIGGLSSQYLSHVFSTSHVPDLYYDVRVYRCDGDRESQIDSGRAQSTLQYQKPQQESGYGDTEADRMYCWYAGKLPSSDRSHQVDPQFDGFRDWARETDNERFLSLLRMFR